MTRGEQLNAEFVKSVFEDGWNRASFEFLQGKTVSEIPFHYNGTTQTVTPGSLPDLVQAWRTAFPDLAVEIRHVIAQEDLVAAALTVRGTHLGPWAGREASGAEVSVEEMMVFRFEDGVLVEMWEVFDEHGLDAQMDSRTSRA
ncbi:MAG: ester cyclase [Acidimicrobiia bacterium]|nr:ester cyclase [Acidimicrobiia bacterium]